MSTSHRPSAPLESHVSPSIFLYVPLHLVQTSTRTPPRIVFFVTGNPGLIPYYHVFLSILSNTEPTTSCVIAGFSLGGFETEADNEKDPGLATLQFPDGPPAPGNIYGLGEQIELTEKRLEALVKRVYAQHAGPSTESDSKDTPQPEVILLGHSVGAYIVLELIRRRAEQQQRKSRQIDDGCAASVDFNIKGAILITPTVSHIAQSASGRVLTPLVTFVPAFAALVAGAARGLVAVLPGTLLRALVGRVTGMPDQKVDAGVGEGEKKGLMGALDATVAFLESETGVRQALEMAGDEMRMIGEDQWGEQVWGAAGVGTTGMDEAAGAGGGSELVGGQTKWTGRPKLVFYFAKTDHWIADHTRNNLVRLRGRTDGRGEEWKPEMVVDEENGLEHGWCIRQSELVAGKAGQWIG